MAHTRYSLEHCRATAKARGGECLSEEYKNPRTKMRWKCKEGYEWEAIYGSLMTMKTWCPHCAGRPRKNINHAHEVAQERGGRCLAAAMDNIGNRLEWECSSGHKWFASYRSIRHTGSWCPECAGVRKKTLADAHDLAAKNGGTCLATEYINSQTPMLWSCDSGHEWMARYSDIQGDEWCKSCAGCATITIDKAARLAVKRGGTLVSQTLKSGNEKVRWRCDKGHEWMARYQDVKHADSWCPRCSHRVSRAEQEMFDIIRTFYSDARQNVRRLLRQPRFELDVWIPSLRTGIEFDGTYWHSFPISRERDRRKGVQCSEAGIALIRVSEDDYMRATQDTIGQVLAQLNQSTRRAA